MPLQGHTWMRPPEARLWAFICGFYFELPEYTTIYLILIILHAYFAVDELTAEGAKTGYKRFIMKISDRIYRIDRINSSCESCNRFRLISHRG